MTPTAGTSILDPLVERAERAPDDVALVFIADDGTRRTMTAAALHAETLAAARALSALGVGTDDVVVLVMEHSLELVATFLGAIHLAAVPCILAYPSERMHPAIYAERVRGVVADSEARVVISTAALAVHMRTLLAETGCRVVSRADMEGGRDGGDPSPSSRPGADRVAFLQYTSGTTGRPKGIAHTHGRVVAYIAARAQDAGFRPDDVVVSWLPLYHDFGLLSGMLIPLAVGMRVVTMSPFHWVRDPKILLRAIHEFGGTIAFMPNFALNHCVLGIRERDLEGLDLGRWRMLGLGGEQVRLRSLRLFVERFGRCGFRENALHAGYGMAENVEGVTMTRPGAPPRADWVSAAALHEQHEAVPAAPGAPGAVSFVSMGPPIPGNELRIVDGEDRPLPERRVGEIAVRSAYMLHGYHRRPEISAEAIRDGWLHTGDLGYLADGELYVCGRTKDLIIVGGRNVYPEDLESLAETVPGLRAGRAVAFGVEDDALGSERVVVVCETDEDAEERRRAVERELRRRAAEEFDVVLGDVRLVGRGWIIKTSNGKLARAANRDRYREQFARRGGEDHGRA